MRYLYLVPLYIFSTGIFVGFAIVCLLPLISRYVDRHCNRMDARLEALRENKQRLVDEVVAVFYVPSGMSEETRKRAN